MPRERNDHERRLAADDLRRAIEEVYRPIEQAIVRNGRACVYRSLLGIASCRMNALYPYTYSDVQWQTSRAVDQDRVPGGCFPQSPVELLAYLRGSSRLPCGSKVDTRTD
jgi:hypothetical protein